MLDPVSSEEDFYLSHLNKSFDDESIRKGAVVNNCGGTHTDQNDNPNLVAIATYERSKSNLADHIKLMRSSSNHSSLR